MQITPHPNTFFDYLHQRNYRGVVPADCWNWGERGLNEYKWKGCFLGWFAGLACRYKSFLFLFCLGCSSRPSKNTFSSPYTIPIPLSPSPSKLDGQPCLVARLLMCVSDTHWDTFFKQSMKHRIPPSLPRSKPRILLSFPWFLLHISKRHTRTNSTSCSFVSVDFGASKTLHRRGIKYTIPRVPECLSLFLNWLSPPPLPQANVSPPLNTKRRGGGGGYTRLLVGEGAGDTSSDD